MRKHTFIFRWTGCLLPALALLVAGGCFDWKMDEPPEHGRPAPEPTPDEPTWRVKPVAMRIYPSTRFVVSGEDAVLEARVQFFDEAEDTTKAVGQMRLELFEARIGESVLAGRRLHTWEIPLRTLKANETHFDPITRAYLFRLRVSGADLAQRRLLVKATFLPVNAERLEATRLIERAAPN